jgi:hypothetical protein
LNRSIITPSSGCWLWKGCKGKNIYGSAYKERRNIQAHRLSWELYRGPIPDGLQVLHRCDVRSCVNPEHLFIGTQSDNMADMYRKQRGARSVFCIRGHEWTTLSAGIKIMPNGKPGRTCLICREELREKGAENLQAWNQNNHA